MKSTRKINPAKHTLVALFLVIATLFSVACSPTNKAVLAATPETTSTPSPFISPSPTPEPTSEPTPVQTHQPSLSLEEERELLGVKNSNSVESLYGVLPFFFKFYNEKGEYADRIVWAFFGSEGDQDGLYDFWSKAKLYSIPVSNSLTMNALWEQREPYNKRFQSAEFVRFCGISELESVYKELGIYWDFPEECIEFFAKGEPVIENYEAPMLELMDLYNPYPIFQ